MATISLEDLNAIPKNLITTEAEAEAEGWAQDWEFDCWTCPQAYTYIRVWIREQEIFVLIQLAELERRKLYWCNIPT